MNKTTLTCIECPIGCTIDVEAEEGQVLSVSGNNCPRGAMYAENEVICPRRVLTTTVRAANGEMIPVKTDAPVRKADMFEIMKKINGAHPVLPVKIGDIIIEDVAEGINLIATGNAPAHK